MIEIRETHIIQYILFQGIKFAIVEDKIFLTCLVFCKLFHKVLVRYTALGKIAPKGDCNHFKLDRLEPLKGLSATKTNFDF